MEKLKRIVVKEELLELTGDFRIAMVLNQFIYWSERTKDFDKYIHEENDRIVKFIDDAELIDKTYGWVYKSADELINECMFTTRTKIRNQDEYQSTPIKNATVLEYVDYLIEQGWLERRNNPKYGYDRTYQYRVNLIKITEDLFNLGYLLQDYKVPLSLIFQQLQKLKMQSTKIENGKTENEPVDNVDSVETSSKIENGTSKIENETSKIENETSKIEEQYHRLLTENTTESTTERKDTQKSSLDNFKNETWVKVKSILKSQMTITTYETWIANIEPISFCDGSLILLTKNSFSKDIIKNKYLETINEVVNMLCDGNINIDITDTII